jgi:hypothetical protein
MQATFVELISVVLAPIIVSLQLLKNQNTYKHQVSIFSAFPYQGKSLLVGSSFGDVGNSRFLWGTVAVIAVVKVIVSITSQVLVYYNITKVSDENHWRFNSNNV